MQSRPVSRQILQAAVLAACAFCLPQADAARPDRNAIVRIDGSSTVYPITEAVAEEFQIAKRIKVTVGISGTGGGFKKFCRGEADITQASRPILAKEMEACKAAGITYIELPVAYDALTVVVNPKNTFIKRFTVDELKKLWAPEAQGKVKTWKQINPSWPDTPVKLFGAGSDSGTFDYFTEAIVGKAKSSRGDFTASEDDNVLVQGVASDVAATGYFGFAYYEENSSRVKAVPIVAKPGAQAVLPSRETVMNGTYLPLSRPLFIYVSANAARNKPNVKAFIDFYLANSKELVEEVKYIALPAHEYAAVAEHWKAQKVGTGFGGEPEVGVKITDLLKRIK